jgi:glucosylceramidase
MNKYQSTIAACLLLPGLGAAFSAAGSAQGETAAAKVYPMPAVKQAIVYVTARDTKEHLNPGKPLNFVPLPQPDEGMLCVMIDPTHRFQSIIGFGGAFTDAAAETYGKLPKEKQEEVISAYFSPDNGIGYTFGRTHINSCDFSSESYAYDDVPGDVGLAHFSIAHDLKARIPLIKAALAMSRGKLQIFASPWSPPAWMKTNGNMLNGGKLRWEDRQAWADYYVKFIQEYQKEGVPIWGLTVQNEPMATQRWESCVYTAAEERDFVRDYLGPTLQKAGLGAVKVMIWDHNRGLMYNRAQVVLSDPKAAEYVWGTAFHWYGSYAYENVRQVADAFPEKNLVFTEGCIDKFQADKMDLWSHGEWYAKNELLDLNSGTRAWTDWNILLDEHGGPNHVGNYCFAPVMANTMTGELHYDTSYYYLGHFSKFIHPGAQRIGCSMSNDGLLATAFINPDNSIAVVVLNITDKPQEYKVWMAGEAVSTHSPAHSIETVVLGD